MGRVPTRTPSRRAVTRSATLRQLFQAVGDVDDPHPLPLQLADDPEQVVDLLVAERGRRLVHDQDPGLGPQRPRDLDELLLGHREAPDFGLGVDRRADPIQEPTRPRPPLAPSDATPAARRLQAQGDVLGHGQVRQQRRLLVDRRDPQASRAHRVVLLDLTPLDLDRPFVGPVRAGDHLDQRRLPRPVLAHQRVDFARAQVERHTLERLDARECLADPRHFQERGQYPSPYAMRSELKDPRIDADEHRWENREAEVYPRSCGGIQGRRESTSRSYALTSASQSRPAGTPRLRQ